MVSQVHVYGSAVSLDPTLVAIKIVDAESEAEAEARAPAAEELELKPLLLARQSKAPRPHSDQQSPSHAVLRFLVALAPNTLFACASGALGLVGAAATGAAALAVLVVALVAQIFEELALMLVAADQALLQFSTGDDLTPTELHHRAVGEQLMRLWRSLLQLSSDLLAIAFFKGTLGASYCSALYVVSLAPALLWAAAVGHEDVASASPLYDRGVFGDSFVAFVAVHAALWLLALGWLLVTASISRFCSQNLRCLCE